MDFPKTLEFFYKQGNSSDGLTPWCKSCRKKYQNEYMVKNREKKNKKSLELYYNDKDKWKMYRSNYLSQNREKAKDDYKRWQEENPEKIRKYNFERRHKNHQISDKEWSLCKQFFIHSCAYCGISEEDAKKIYGQRLHRDHVDHDGSNDITNCIPSCRSCNSSKWAHPLEEWYNVENEHYSSERLSRIKEWVEHTSHTFQ